MVIVMGLLFMTIVTNLTYTSKDDKPPILVLGPRVGLMVYIVKYVAISLKKKIPLTPGYQTT